MSLKRWIEDYNTDRKKINDTKLKQEIQYLKQYIDKMSNISKNIGDVFGFDSSHLHTDFYHVVPLTFNTGGYTGTWSSDGGKLAVLHQKQLVLNATDTKNMLDIVSMVRDMSNNLRNSSLSIPSLISGLTSSKNNNTNQNINITANFPNATNHNEIEQALNNLINRTSQWIGTRSY